MSSVGDITSAWKRVVGYGIGGLIPASVLVLYNLKTTGQPFLSGYSLLEDEIGRFFGFGDTVALIVPVLLICRPSVTLGSSASSPWGDAAL